VEIKAAHTWRKEYGTPLKALIDKGKLRAGYGTYLGTSELRDGQLRILPLKKFLKELASGNVLPADAG
jgi:hypothetical protein